MYSFIRPLLFKLDAETAHNTTLDLLAKAHTLGVLPMLYPQQTQPVTCMGIEFKNPVGLAAGLDKNGKYIDALAALGFGFIEIGTITPKPQDGNPKPRMFRIPEAGAVINRMGFNNAGVHELVKNVEKSQYKGVLGINIGKNAVTPVENAADDYLYCLEHVYKYATYVTVNISSPNTKNLRDLQEGDALSDLLSKLKTRQGELAQEHGKYVPLVLKVAPDLTVEQVEHIAQQLIKNQIDGLIVSNTSTGRVGVEGMENANEGGGLSGAPISHISDTALQNFSKCLDAKIPLIGVGGINTGSKAKAKIKSGAALVQLYSGMVYQGPALINECVKAIAR